MDIITLIIGGLILGFFVFYLAWMVYTIACNLVNGRKFHEGLNKKVSQLRLGKMLSALGINQASYVYQTASNDVEKHISQCTDCHNTASCDNALDSGKNVSIDEIDFCANQKELSGIKDQAT